MVEALVPHRRNDGGGREVCPGPQVTDGVVRHKRVANVLERHRNVPGYSVAIQHLVCFFWGGRGVRFFCKESFFFLKILNEINKRVRHDDIVKLWCGRNGMHHTPLHNITHTRHHATYPTTSHNIASFLVP